MCFVSCFVFFFKLKAAPVRYGVPGNGGFLLRMLAFRNSICFLKSSNSLQEQPYCKSLFRLCLLPISQGINQPYLHRAGALLSEVCSAPLPELSFAVWFIRDCSIWESFPLREKKPTCLAWIFLVKCSLTDLVTHSHFYYI